MTGSVLSAGVARISTARRLANGSGRLLRTKGAGVSRFGRGAARAACQDVSRVGSPAVAGRAACAGLGSASCPFLARTVGGCLPLAPGAAAGEECLSGTRLLREPGGAVAAAGGGVDSTTTADGALWLQPLSTETKPAARINSA